jgi:hypothetical protein
VLRGSTGPMLHASEQEFRFIKTDRIFKNHATIEDLHKAVDEALEREPNDVD